MNMKKLLIEIAGWYGVVAIFGSYALLTLNMMSATSVAYQLLNFTGSIGLILEARVKKDWQLVVLNVIWMFIALIGLVNILR